MSRVGAARRYDGARTESEKHMLITDIQTVVVDAARAALGTGRRTWLFVEVHTDEGVLGIGEASQSRLDAGVRAAVEEMKPYYVGKDPLGLIEPQRRQWLANPFASRVRYAAVSGIEQALWDIAGKALGQPVHVLLGGAIRERIPLYANLSQATPSRSPDDLATTAAQAVSDGFRAVKIYPFPQPQEVAANRGVALTRDEIVLAEARIRAVRDAIGPDVALHTDWAWTVTPGDAAALADRLLPYDLFWIEEPFATDDPEELAALRRHIRPRLAGGEQLSERLPFRQLFQARALDVVMPDVKWIGGISAFREIAALAAAYDVEVSPHNMSGPVATAACVHLSAVLGNFLALEYGYAGVPWRDELVAGSELVEHGTIPLPTAPGLGIEWDGAAARRHAGE
ncbi:MAG: mandelate racemase/muconate lactonizing enzyme family protein [Chloroflexi bacterium]|nr:mandelate racemase/muconate lactonizing enzyme family protein [Chloroflexota bacterium]